MRGRRRLQLDNIWLVVLSILSAVAGYFARILVDSVMRAIQALWDESKKRRRHKEALEMLREQHAHIKGLREIDIEREVIKQGMSTGRYESGVRNPRRSN